MAHRIEVATKILDTRAQIKKKHFENAGLSGKINDVQIVDVYTIDNDFDNSQLSKISSMFSNKVFQEAGINEAKALGLKGLKELLFQ